MTTILSLSKNSSATWAAGPEGLFRVDDELVVTPQPQEQLYSCCAIHDRIFVGGYPHVVAYSINQQGDDWQAGWVDNVEAPVLVFAADPQVAETGVILAGTDGGGILRTVNRGGHWFTRNFGLETFSVLSISWAPISPNDIWPRWRYVYAATEEGVYLSPNGGRGWKHAECDEAVYQVIGVSPLFHSDGVVLAGTESDGLYRSTDKGHTFTPVEASPRRVNALATTDVGWVLSDEETLWQSGDGLTWEPIEDSHAALTLLWSDGQLMAGNVDGLATYSL